jgi:Fe2+ or Zn2+ uptake regulation protein
MTRVTAAERLKRAGERVTAQRVAMAEALANDERPQTAAELWRRLRVRGRSVGRATIFRGLDALVAAGVARRLELPNHVYGYVACPAIHHHHLACVSCGRVLEIDESFVREMASSVRSATGFQIEDARLDFYGRCATCAAELPSLEAPA